MQKANSIEKIAKVIPVSKIEKTGKRCGILESDMLEQFSVVSKTALGEGTVPQAYKNLRKAR